MADAMSGLSGAASGAAAGTAIAPGIGTAIGAGIGGLIGLFGGGGDDEAEKLRKQLYQDIKNLQIPDIEQLKLQLEEYKSQGKITPEQEEAILQEASGMSQVSTDPRLKGAQMTALEKMQQIGNEGLLAQDRAALDSVTREVARDTQAKNEAVLQNMAARGAGGSGAELAAQLANNQSAADRGSQQGLNIAAQANMRALEAIAKSGQLGGQIRSQDFGEQEAKARAQDVINNFNTSNRSAVQARNIAARNAAQEANLKAAQKLADANVGLRNTQQQYNKNLVVDDYNRRLGQVKAASGAGSDLADGYDKSAQRGREQTANIISGLGTIAGGFAKSPSSTTSTKPTGQETEDFMNRDNTAGFTMPGKKK
jgi:hypothetical protein